MDNAKRIAENLVAVQGRIADAARKSDRPTDSVRLVAVTKYVGLDETQALLDAGCCDLGESRPQDLWRKAEILRDTPVRWHQIGHMQRNKARRTAPWLALLHSVDSVRLLKTLDPLAAELGRPLPVLLEINVSGEEAKHGFSPDDLAPVLDQTSLYSHLEIRGLMAMAGLSGGSDEARHDFAALRALRDRLAINCPPSVSLAELSMGMSGDFELAIAEGATLVRVGSALFEGV